MTWMIFHPIKNTGSTPYLYIDLPPAQPSNEPLVEAISAVKQIQQSYPAPYTLMLSGGVDSQAMLYAWIQSGVPFNTLTISYYGMNQHDIETLDEFRSVNDINIPLDIQSFDVVAFLENEYPKYALQYECSSPQLCTHMKMSETITSGTVVFSGNFICCPELGGPSLTYAVLGLMRYAERSSRSIVPFFFQHTPELAYSFIKYLDRTEPNAYLAKVKAFTSAGFPVVKQDDKFTGFEKIKDYYDQFSNRVSIKSKLQYASKPSKRTFDRLFRYPYEQIINDPRIEFTYSFLDKPGAP